MVDFGLALLTHTGAYRRNVQDPMAEADPEVVRTQVMVKLADFAKQIFRDTSFREHRAAVFKEFERECKAQLREQHESHQREVGSLQATVQKLTAQMQEERGAANLAIR